MALGWEARGDTAKAKQVRIDGESFGDGVEFEVSPTLQPTARLLLNKEVALGLLVGLGFGSILAWYLEDTAAGASTQTVGDAAVTAVRAGCRNIVARIQRHEVCRSARPTRRCGAPRSRPGGRRPTPVG